MNQKLSDWAAVAEIASGIAVVITLIVLILEIRGNSEAIRAATLSDVAGRTHTQIVANMSNPALVEALAVEARGGELTDSQEFLLGQTLGALLKLAEESYMAYRDGYLDEEVWLTRVEIALDNLSREPMRRRWTDRRNAGWYIDDFVAHIDAEIVARYGQ